MEINVDLIQHTRLHCILKKNIGSITIIVVPSLLHYLRAMKTTDNSIIIRSKCIGITYMAGRLKQIFMFAVPLNGASEIKCARILYLFLLPKWIFVQVAVKSY